MATVPYLVIASIDAAFSVALAGVVYVVAPRAAANRILACVLLIEGGVQLSAALSGDLGPVSLEQSAWLGVFGALFPFLPACYLILLRRLDSPLVAPLRPRFAPSLLLGAAGLAALAFVLPVQPRLGLLEDLLLVHGAVSLFGLVVAFDAWRRAPRGSPTRRRNALFIAAFGVRDILFSLYVVDYFIVEPASNVRFLDVPTPYFTTLFFVPLLAYAILQGQVLGIELRLKTTIRRGTLAGAFVAVFFVVSEAAQQILQATIGPWIGLLAAALLVLALAPLQRMADRIANAALPGVVASDEYLAYRRVSLYRAAVESAAEVGGLTQAERDMLVRLREKLGITAESALLVEREAGLSTA